ncbi:zinc finger protein 135-like isoform X2 [Pectinophora gossypiella]|uniref:zinc finger protein 135-like isoform X2 n=1 Tax=Pectinophora gossypiella TaxID=13191 RepID=UPI00214EC82F|nr:zinc finger protein 135-like isoform X2 [Pectinophora gossypiella]
MDKCGICLKPAVQLFETGKEGVYACFKCQPLVPEVTIGENGEQPGQVLEDQTEKDEDKSFQKSGQLQNHLRNHRAERRFICTYCNKAFSQSNNLRAHLRIHTNERPYKCSECGKAFTQVTNLNNHVRLHTGERPFVCPEPGCNKAYAQVTNLNQHRKRHLNGRPVETTYDCTICGEQFQQRNHMYTHRRDVHAEVPKASSQSPMRRHVCKLCDLALPNERQLQQHVAQHVADHSPSEPEDNASDGSLSCVFRSCGARLSSAHEHTEHLLSAHQLRVLTARAPQPPRRGRPPKGHTAAILRKTKQERDPLEIKEPAFRPIKIINADDMQFTPKLKAQLFQ